MGDDAECEFARSGADARTVRDGRSARGGPRRALLRAADGVRIEAAYDPYEGGAGSADGGGRAQAPGAFVLAHGFTGSVARPALRRAVRVFAQYGAVVTFSFRGHGGSGGHSTVGDLEVLDLAAAVDWARSLGHGRVATVGFSMGGSVVVRHGALYRPGAHEGRTDAQPLTERERPERTGEERAGRQAAGPEAVRRKPAAYEPEPEPEPAAYEPGKPVPAGAPHTDAVVAVSAPARWYYRGTAPMRRLHWVIQRPVGRLVSRYGLRTRVHHRDWDPVPLSPVAAAPLLAPTPLLVVHGDQDPYFPVDHPTSLAAAGHPDHTELWLVEGFGHAENAAEPPLLHRIGSWVADRWPDPAGGPA